MPRPARDKRDCDVEGCSSPFVARNMCGYHWRRWRRLGITPPGVHTGSFRWDPCLVASCSRPSVLEGVCTGHYQRLQTNGVLDEDRPLISRTGRYVDPDGYVIVHGVAEHRRVMADQLGRPLLPGETVHHRNGDRADNRPDNLELWSGNHPRGARVRDHVAWAKRVLKLYGDDEECW
jgi:hypothetical protein